MLHRWESVEKIVLAGNGEVFYSPNYNKIIEGISDQNFPALKTIVLFTNAVLFTENKWDKCKWLADKYDIEVTVSVDAFTEKTYNKIRRGGVFSSLRKNLQMIARLRSAGKVKHFQLNFCVQKDNYLEMEDFAKWAEELGVDRLWFQIVRNVTGTESIHDINHPDYMEFVEMLKKPVFKQKWIDMEQIKNEIHKNEFR